MVKLEGNNPAGLSKTGQAYNMMQAEKRGQGRVTR
jgi:cysteine synthase